MGRIITDKEINGVNRIIKILSTHQADVRKRMLNYIIGYDYEEAKNGKD